MDQVQPTCKDGRKSKGSGSIKRATPDWQLEWSDELTMLLIQWYRCHAYMWNCKEPDYMNKLKKRLCIQSWLQQSGNWPSNLADESDYDWQKARAERVKEVERKFHGLRTRLNTELKKIPEWRSGAGVDDIAVNQSDWKFFNDLLFLKDVIASGIKTKSNFYEPAANTGFNVLENDHSTSNHNTNDNGSQFIVLSEIQASTVGHASNAEEIPSGVVFANWTKPVTKIANKIEENDKRKCIRRCLEILESPQEKVDRVDHFFKYCSETVRGLALSDQNKALMEIQELLFKYTSSD